MADEIQSNIRINVQTADALSNLKNLQRQISAFHTSMASGSAQNAAAARNLQGTLIDNINATKKFSASLQNIKTTAESFTQSLEKNKLSLNQYFKYAVASSKNFGQVFEREQRTIDKVARERVKDLQTQYIKLQRTASGALGAISVRPLMLDMDSLATKTAIAAEKQALMNQLLKQGSTNLLNFGKNTQWAGRQLMVGFTIPLSIFGSTAAKTFMQVEEQAIKFRRVYGDLMTESAETEQMLNQIKELASEFTKYGVAIDQTMGLAAQAAASGKQGADLIAQVSEATRLSILGQVDNAQALETTISVTNAFGVAAEDLAGKIDFLNAVENQTVTSIEDLTIAVPKAGPVIKQLGGTVEDLAFFLTAMKEGGINASEGANALKSGLASLINPTEKASAMLGGFGINIKSIVESNKGDVKGVVIDFANALDRLDPLARARAIEQLFGKFQFSRLSTLFQNVIADGTQASRVLDLASATSEQLANMSAKELSKISESPMYKFKKAIEDIKAELAPVGELFLKIATPFIEFGSTVLKAFNSLDEGAKKFIGGLLAVLGGIGPIAVMTFGLLANGVAQVIKGFLFLKTLFNKAQNATTGLGGSTEYLTSQQIEAASVAASLDQVHGVLTQTFSTEASAVNLLTAAYEKAISAQQRFIDVPAIARTRPAGVKRFASGGMVGGSGNGDIVPSLLTPGEFVVKKDVAQPNMGFLQALNAGRVKGFAEGGEAAARRKLSFAKYEAILPGFSELFASTSQASGSNSIIGQLTRIANTLTEVAGTSPGASSVTGVNAAHGNARKIMSVEEARALGAQMYAAGESGRTARKLKNAQKFGTEDISAFSNLVFPMPRAANLGEISGKDLSEWISSDPARFTSMISANQGIDKNDPGLKDFSNRVASMMTSAGAEAITESKFEEIISSAIEQQVEGAAQKALISARDTYSTFNVTDNPSKRAKREPAAKGFGMSASGQLLSETGSRSYIRVRQAMANAGEWTKFSQASNEFVKTTLNKMIQGVKDSTRQASPSKEAYDAGQNIGEGAIQGIEDSVKKARKRVRVATTAGAPGQTSIIATPVGAQSLADATARGRISRRVTAPQTNYDNVNLSARTAASELRQVGEQAKKSKLSMIGLNDKLTAMSLGFSGLSGAAMMFGDANNKAVQAINIFSTALFGVSSVMQMMGGTTLQNFLGGRARKGSIAVRAASAFGGLGAGATGPIQKFGSMIAKAGVFVRAFLGPIGLATVALTGLTAIIKFSMDYQEEQRKKLEGLGDAAKLTTDQLKTLGSFFGKEPRKTALEMAQATAATPNTQEAARALSLTENADFKNTFKDTIETLRTAAAKDVVTTFETLTLSLFSRGYAKQEVQDIINALRVEAGRQNVKFEVNSFDVSTKGGREALKKSASKLLSDFEKAAKTVRTETFESVSNNMAQLVTKNNVADPVKANQLAVNMEERLQALNTLLANGEISLKEYKAQWAALTGQIEKSQFGAEMAQMVFSKFVAKLKNIDTDSAKAVEGLKGANYQFLVMQGAMTGVIATADEFVKVMQIIGRIQEYRNNPGSISADQFIRAQEQLSLIQKEIDSTNKAIAEANKATGASTPFSDKVSRTPEKTPFQLALEAAGKNTKDAQNSINAYRKLIKAGYDTATALEIAKDATLAAGLANQTVGSDNWKRLTKAIDEARDKAEKFAELDLQANYDKKMQSVQEAFAAQEEALRVAFERATDADSSLISSLESQIATISDGIDDLEYSLDQIAKQEEAINKTYDDREKALDKIFEANRSIAEQQQSQLDIAEALSSGDISAAAAAVANARNIAQQRQQELQKQQLGLARESELAGVNVNGQTRLSIESQILAKREQIAKLEEEQLEPAQTRIRLAQERLDKDIKSLEVAGNTKLKWDEIQSGINLAKTNTDEFKKSLDSAALAAKNLKDLLDSLNTSKPVAAGSQDSGNEWRNAVGMGAGSTSYTYRTPPAALSFLPRRTLEQMGYYSNGGIIKPKYFNSGALARGTDTIPAMLTPGEFVVSKYGVEKFGVDNLRAVNSGTYGGNSVYNYELNVSVSSSNASPNDIAQAVMSQIRQVDAQRIRGNRI